MDKYTIIHLKRKGQSNRKIASELGIDRKTVAKVWNNYQSAQFQLVSRPDLTKEEIERLTEEIVNHSYNSQNRINLKLTPEVFKRIADILTDEEEKKRILGNRHKQKLTATQIHQMLREEGIDIGLTTVTNAVRELKAAKEVFIKQEYEFGDRLEYDFGEVRLVIDGKMQKYYLAVFASPAGKFRWAYLYTAQDQKVFLDSHVRFFAMTKGTWKEVVYDNMRNVVSRFIGKNEKELNQKLIDLALYYNFEINVTNCFSGNEKGYVESSVKKLRNSIFARKYQFESLDDAQNYLEEQLTILNEDSLFEEEKAYLRPVHFNYELAEILVASVDKYSCIRVENNFYSVPDYLIKKKITVKNYLDHMLIYSNNTFVCEHKKVNGVKEYQLELSHYIKTLRKKPGALKNALVLKQYPQLHTIYQTHFKAKPKEFIERLIQLQDEPLDVIIAQFEQNTIQEAISKSQLHESVLINSINQLQTLSHLMARRYPHG